MSDRDAAPAHRSIAGRPIVHLAIGHERNRQLLAEYLGDAFEVQRDGELEDAEFDVCILDAAAFAASADALQERKREAEPVFLPSLLVTGGRGRETTPPTAWDVVDDVVDPPIHRRTLRRRLENLLDNRRLSLELNRRRERSEERFRSLFRSAPDPIVVTTPDGVVSAVNRSFLEIFDTAEREVIGRPLSDLDYSPADPVDRVLLRVEDRERDAASGEVLEWELDSEERLVTELRSEVVTELGEVTERIGIFRDITDLAEHEALLVKQNERLQEFAGMIAHDLRNPLTLASGYLDRARETGAAEDFDTIEQAMARMEQLLDEVLTLAHLGQAVLEPETLELARVASNAWEHVETADTTLVVDVDCAVEADESRLSELFENLFRNATEHANGDTTVRVGELEDEPGFFVADDGPGIPRTDRDDVFEVGYTTTDSGTGFGLSIVRQVVDGHGWTVSVTESADGGARFEFAGVGSPTD